MSIKLLKNDATTNLFILSKKLRVIEFFLFFLFAIIPSFVYSKLYDGTQTIKYLSFSVILSVIGIFCLSQFKQFRSKVFIFKPIDIGLIILFVYIIFNTLIRNSYPFSLKGYEFLMLCICFAFLKQLPKSIFNQLIFTSIIGAIIQSIIGNLQVHNLLSSQHALFKVTGSFFNPGPFASYLASSYPLALALLIYKKDQSPKYNYSNRSIRLHIINLIKTNTPLVGVFSILVLIPGTGSRTAIIAIILSSAYISFARYSPIIRNYFNKNKELYLVLIIFVCSGLYYLYSIKINSSNGRIFIWKNVFTIIKEAPLFGKGLNSFEGLYMNVQANYFRLHPGNSYSDLADNVQYAFNEFLQFGLENGVIGILIVLGILFSLFRTKGNDLMLICGKAGIISIIALSLFSYPLHILSIKLNMLLYLAMISRYQEKRVLSLNISHHYRFYHVMAYLFIALFTLNIYYTSVLYKAFKNWGEAAANYRTRNYAVSIALFRNEYEVFKNNGAFLTQYGKNLSMLNMDKEAIIILKEAAKRSNSTVVQLALGDSYRRTGQFELSKSAYTNAHYMIPNRLYPQYLLAKLFLEFNQYGNAIKTAKEILKKRAKVESEASSDIYKEMKELIILYDK